MLLIGVRHRRPASWRGEAADPSAPPSCWHRKAAWWNSSAADPADPQRWPSAFGEQRAAEEVQPARPAARASRPRSKDEKHRTACCCAWTTCSRPAIASLREVAAALAKFKRLRASRSSPLAKTYSQTQYLLAAQANEIYIDPMSQGGVMLEGLGRVPPVLPRGRCRTSWAWTCTCSRWASTSPPPNPTCWMPPRKEAKEADLYWMNDVWQRLLADIAKVRKTASPRPALAARASTRCAEGRSKAAGGDLGQATRCKQKLVDGLKTQRRSRGPADRAWRGRRGFADTGFRAIVAMDTAT